MLYKYYMQSLLLSSIDYIKLIKILKNQEGYPDLSKYTVCNCVLSCIPLDQDFVCTCNITVSEDCNL